MDAQKNLLDSTTAERKTTPKPPTAFASNFLASSPKAKKQHTFKFAPTIVHKKKIDIVFASLSVAI